MPKIQLRRGTAAQWSSVNPTLLSGEFGVETDTSKFKLGNGTSNWNTLPYAQSGGLQPTPHSLTISNAFTNPGTWNGSSPVTLDLPETIQKNALTASTLKTARTINGATFDGSASIVAGGAIFGQAATSGAAFRNIYASPSASAPTSPQNGDVWIAW